MSDIKIFKIITGEEVISEVAEVKDTHFILKNPSELVLQQTDDGVSVGLVKFMPYASKNVVGLYVTSIVAEAIPDDNMIKEYKRVFGLIATPDTGIILPNG